MNPGLRLVCSVVVLCLMGCQPVEKQVVGKWTSPEANVDFMEDGTFTLERGLLGTQGKFFREGPDQLRLEYAGVVGVLAKLKETVAGPSQTIVKVRLQGGLLSLTWPEGKEITFRRLGR